MSKRAFHAIRKAIETICAAIRMNVSHIASAPTGRVDSALDPTKVIAKRVTAEVDGYFVVFLIGMRVNKPLKLHKWLPLFRCMRRMLQELETRPDAGLLGWRYIGGRTFIQYWRSFEHLEAYAREPTAQHWPAWVAFNRRMKDCRGDVGIWHETYFVRAGEYEAIYSGMPPSGLGKVGRLVDASGSRESARQRLRVDHRRNELHGIGDRFARLLRKHFCISHKGAMDRCRHLHSHFD